MSDTTTVTADAIEETPLYETVPESIKATVTRWVKVEGHTPREMIKYAMGSLRSCVSRIVPDGYERMLVKAQDFTALALALDSELETSAITDKDLAQIELFVSITGREVPGFDPAEIAQRKNEAAIAQLTEALGEEEALKFLQAQTKVLRAKTKK